MNGLVDSHAHLDDPRFDKDRAGLIAAFPEDNIAFVINPGADLASSQKAVALAAEYTRIYAAVGIHPHDAKTADASALANIGQLAGQRKVVAIGEIGLDYYYEHSPRDLQQTAFYKQMELAESLNLPAIIHSRDAHEDTYRIIKEFSSRVSGVMHCFSGSAEMAKRYLQLGYFISLAGPITFKNARVAVEVAKMVPLDRLLVETDSPYLTPEPHRGKRNEPKYVRYVVQAIARQRGLDLDQVILRTAENTRRLFGIGSESI